MKTPKKQEPIPDNGQKLSEKTTSGELDEIRKLIRRKQLENKVFKKLSDELLSSLAPKPQIKENAIDSLLKATKNKLTPKSNKTK